MAQNNIYIHLQLEVNDLKNVLLASNDSTVDVFGNEHFLGKIWLENVKMIITTNTGNLIVKIIRYFPGYPYPVW